MKYISVISIFLLAGAVGISAETAGPRLNLRENPSDQSISVFRNGEEKPILTQNARLDSRPFIHLLGAMEGKTGTIGRETEGDRSGLFWGFGKVNGRDFYNNSGAGFWHRVSSRIVTRDGPLVGWQTVYQLLDQAGQPIMEETQDWTMRDSGGNAVLDLTWTGKALTDILVGQSASGGLSLVLPSQAAGPSFMNSQRQADARAGGRPAAWLDIGTKIEAGGQPVRITIFDNPKNPDSPTLADRSKVRHWTGPGTGRRLEDRARRANYIYSPSHSILR